MLGKSKNFWVVNVGDHGAFVSAGFFGLLATGLYSLQVFLGPRGPLVLPLIGPVPSRPVPSALKIWITYIQAYMPYES